MCIVGPVTVGFDVVETAIDLIMCGVAEKLWVWPFSSTFFPCLPNMYKPEKKLSILTTGEQDHQICTSHFNVHACN